LLINQQGRRSLFGANSCFKRPGSVETILSEILIESMERLCILSEKTPSNLRTSENGWREKYQSYRNSPSSLACCQNPMELETTICHNFYIHSALLPYPMVCEEFLTQIIPTYITFHLVRWRVHARTAKKAPSFLGLNQVWWRVYTRMP
jgi:hypothetical protein